MGGPVPGFLRLALRARAGDREAMGRMISSVRSDLDRVARPFSTGIRPAQSTADLLQDSCLRAWQRFGTFRVGRDDGETFALFRSWMGRIVRNIGVDAQRAGNRQKRRPPAPILSIDQAGDPERSASDRGIDPPARVPRPSAYARGVELDRKIHAALERMPDRQDAQIVRMHAFDGLSLAEIASRLGLGYDLVREHYWAATERLKRELRDWL